MNIGTDATPPPDTVIGSAARSRISSLGVPVAAFRRGARYTRSMSPVLSTSKPPTVHGVYVSPGGLMNVT